MARRWGPRIARCLLAAAAWGTAFGVAAQPGLSPDARAALERQVADTERAFARSMAERDAQAFAGHLSEQAVFFGRTVLYGKAAVADGWRRYFEGREAPFSWEPDLVVVSADGLLAHSSGPVRDPAGRIVARFNSIWRLEAPGTWRIVFDKGEAWQEPPK